MEFEGMSVERAQRIIAHIKEIEKLQFSGELKRIAEERNIKIKKEWFYCLKEHIMQEYVDIRTSRLWSEIAFATRKQQHEKRKIVIDIIDNACITREILGGKRKIEPQVISVDIKVAEQLGLIKRGRIRWVALFVQDAIKILHTQNYIIMFGRYIVVDAIGL